MSTGFQKGHEAETRPEIVSDEHLDYLDALRESGETNMFGARPYVQAAFPELSDDEAAEVLGYWMQSFGKADR